MQKRIKKRIKGRKQKGQMSSQLDKKEEVDGKGRKASTQQEGITNGERKTIKIGRVN